MKLITLNTHSLIEEHYEEKLRAFADLICKERPDILAMQEVNQLASEEILPDDLCVAAAFPFHFGRETMRRGWRGCFRRAAFRIPGPGSRQSWAMTVMTRVWHCLA